MEVTHGCLVRFLPSPLLAAYVEDFGFFEGGQNSHQRTLSSDAGWHVINLGTTRFRFVHGSAPVSELYGGVLRCLFAGFCH